MVYTILESKHSFWRIDCKLKQFAESLEHKDFKANEGNFQMAQIVSAESKSGTTSDQLCSDWWTLLPNLIIEY